MKEKNVSGQQHKQANHCSIEPLRREGGDAAVWLYTKVNSTQGQFFLLQEHDSNVKRLFMSEVIYVPFVMFVLFLDLAAALPEVNLLPHHCAPHAEETPEIVEGATVKWVFISAAVFEVRDAVAWHKLPGGGVERNQVEVGTEQEQYDQRE